MRLFGLTSVYYMSVYLLLFPVYSSSDNLPKVRHFRTTPLLSHKSLGGFLGPASCASMRTLNLGGAVPFRSHLVLRSTQNDGPCTHYFGMRAILLDTLELQAALGAEATNHSSGFMGPPLKAPLRLSSKRYPVSPIPFIAECTLNDDVGIPAMV